MIPYAKPLKLRGRELTYIVVPDRDGFFDARDLVKYEMLRQVSIEGAKKADAAALFGVSRPTLYQPEAAFAQQGLAGLLPQQRGPKRGRPMAALWPQQPTVQARRQHDHHLTQPRFAQEVRGEFAIDLQGSPITVLPLTKALSQFALVLRSHGEQRTVTFSTELDVIIRVESEAMRAARVIQPTANEFELVG